MFPAQPNGMNIPLPKMPTMDIEGHQGKQEMVLPKSMGPRYIMKQQEGEI
jgi:hypothetical protein